MGEICKVVVRQRRGSKGLSALANPLGSGGTDGGDWGRVGATACHHAISLYLIIDINQYNIKYINTKHNCRKLLYSKDLGWSGLPRPS